MSHQFRCWFREFNLDFYLPIERNPVPIYVIASGREFNLNSTGSISKYFGNICVLGSIPALPPAGG